MVIGLFFQAPDNHLQGQGCPKCGDLRSIQASIKTSEEWIESFNLAHPTMKYEYPKSIEGAFNCINIFCNIHKLYFTQSPHNHARGQGCPLCAKDNHSLSCRKDYQTYLCKFYSIYGDKYVYPLERTSNYLTIVCKEHGEFTKLPTKHLAGEGCPTCSRQESSGNSWSHSGWIEHSIKSKNFDSFKVYVIICFNGDEKFIKIGRTFTTLEERFKGSSQLPYDYYIVKEIICNDGKECCLLEDKLKSILKDFKYIPLKDFGGKFECFLIDSLNLLNEHLS